MIERDADVDEALLTKTLAEAKKQAQSVTAEGKPIAGML